MCCKLMPRMPPPTLAAGTVLVTLADSSNTQQGHSVLGDGLAVGAAALYALYTILMRRSLAEDDGLAVARFFGYIGAGTAVGVAPVLVVMQWGGALDVWQVQPLALTLAVVNGEGGRGGTGGGSQYMQGCGELAPPVFQACMVCHPQGPASLSWAPCLQHSYQQHVQQATPCCNHSRPRCRCAPGRAALVCRAAAAHHARPKHRSTCLNVSIHPAAVCCRLPGVLNYVVADYLWARAVLTLGPTAATVGMSAQIPLATLADAFLGSPTWLQQARALAMTAGGTAAIMAGFVGFNMLPSVVHGTGGVLEQDAGSQRSSSVVGTHAREAGGSAAGQGLGGAHDHCQEPPA